MAFVITAPCFGCKSKDCIVGCPTESFHEGEQMLYIDPESCIDCELCVSACPVNAIFHEDDVPEEWSEFIRLNAELSQTTPSAHP